MPCHVRTVLPTVAVTLKVCLPTIVDTAAILPTEGLPQLGASFNSPTLYFKSPKVYVADQEIVDAAAATEVIDFEAPSQPLMAVQVSLIEVGVPIDTVGTTAPVQIMIKSCWILP